MASSCSAAPSDARGIAGSLDDIGKTLQMLGRYDEAHAKITEALARRGKRGDKRAIATSLSRLGDVQQDRGQYESRVQLPQGSARAAQGQPAIAGAASSRRTTSPRSRSSSATSPRRAPAWLAALPEAEAIGALPLAALILTNLGEVALVDGKLDEARSRLENALEIIEDIEDRGLESECCRHLATLEKLQGHTGASKTTSQ